jgi:alanine racemase
LQALVGPQVRLLSMIKSDAYGHGLIETAKALAEIGADAFGVAEVDEGVMLRESGVRGQVFIFLGSYCFAELIDYELTPIVFDLANIRALSAYAEKRNTAIGVHLKVDTGMGRLGVMLDEAPLYVEEIEKLPGVFLLGLLSHFPMADQPESPSTEAQDFLFGQLRKGLRSDSLDPVQGLLHIANSAALMHFPKTHHKMVRPGISLYGCYPSTAGRSRKSLGLKPVMSFATQIVQLKNVPPGYGVSYGHLFKTSRPSRLAILPVGYADGYLRRLTGKAEVLIRGKRAPVCGRVCMNATVVDVTDIPEAQVLDEVILLGTQTDKEHSGEITADEVAGWLETISYEVLCLFGTSNRRVYR